MNAPIKSTLTKTQMDYAANRARDICAQRKSKRCESIKNVPVPSYSLAEKERMIRSGKAALREGSLGDYGYVHHAFVYPETPAMKAARAKNEANEKARNKIRTEEDANLQKILDNLYLCGNGAEALAMLAKYEADK